MSAYNLSTFGSQNQLIIRINLYEAYPSEVHYCLRTILTLKQILRNRNLKVLGSKDELIKRLEEEDYKIRTRSSQTRSLSSKRFLTDIDDINYGILLKLDDESLGKVCRINKYGINLFKNKKFWNKKIQSIYNINLNNYVNENMTYRKAYYGLKRCKKNVNNQMQEYAYHGYLPLLKYLLEDAGYSSSNGTSILIQAVSGGQLDVVKYVIEEADTYVDSEYGLRYAAQYGYSEILQYLIEKAGAKVNDHNGLALCNAVKNGYLDIVRYLIVVAGAFIHASNDFPLRIALKQSNLKMARYLVYMKADFFINDVEASPSVMYNFYINGYSALDMTIYLEYLTEDDRLLICATQYGFLNMVKCLVNSGVNIHARKDAELRVAVGYGQLGIAK